MKRNIAQRGLTLIELLVVVAIMGLLASIVLAALSQTRFKARDVVRVEEVQQIQKALELYHLSNGRYPNADGDGCGGWDVGNAALPFMNNSGMSQYFANNPVPVDGQFRDDCTGFRYYYYPAGAYGCPI